MSRYHPLPSSGKLSLVDIAKEKLMINEWDTPTSKISLVGLATEQPGYGNPTTLNRDTDINPYPIINSIEKTPYSITGLRITETPIDYTGWYGYNHLTEYDPDTDWTIEIVGTIWTINSAGSIPYVQAAVDTESWYSLYPEILLAQGVTGSTIPSNTYVYYYSNYTPNYQQIRRVWLTTPYTSMSVPFGYYLSSVELTVIANGPVARPEGTFLGEIIQLGIKPTHDPTSNWFSNSIIYRTTLHNSIVSVDPINQIVSQTFYFDKNNNSDAIAYIENQITLGSSTTWTLCHPYDDGGVYYGYPYFQYTLDSTLLLFSFTPKYIFSKIASVISTDALVTSTTTSVTIALTVHYIGQYRPEQAGICYKLASSNGDPVFSDGYVDISGYEILPIKGQFSVTISNLTPDTLYKFRAFLTDEGNNTYYGNTIIESPLMLPTVITYDATEITLSSAKFGGTVERSGGRPVQHRGVVWQYNYLSQWPVYAFDETEYVGYGLGEFFVSVYDFEPYVIAYRAFAVTAFGVGYGEKKLLYLQQPEGDPPTVVTTTPYNIGDTTATAGGNVTDEGDGTVTRKGIAWVPGNWEILPYPDLTYHSEDGSGLGSFTSYMTALTPGSYYLMRAYAENEYGVGLGETKGFMTTGDTPELLPTVTTSPITNITSTTATCGGNVIDEGAKPVFKRGCLWIEASAGRDPIEGDYEYVSGSGEGSFPAYLTGLDGETNYRVVAFAKSMMGISYGIVRTILRETPVE